MPWPVQQKPRAPIPRPRVEPAPWERQYGETHKAFLAFSIYRDLGEKRSIPVAARKYGKGESLVGRWCFKWRWQDRATAWQSELDRVAREAQREEIAEMAKRQARQAHAVQEASFLPVAALLQRYQQDPQAFVRIADLHTLFQYAMIGAKILPAAAEAERAARLGPEIAEQAANLARGTHGQEGSTQGAPGGFLGEFSTNPKALDCALRLVDAVCSGEAESGGIGDAGDRRPGTALAVVSALAGVESGVGTRGVNGQPQPLAGVDAASTRQE